MSWFEKLLPPKIKRKMEGNKKNTVPEGLWSKCPSCDAVLYRAELEQNQEEIDRLRAELIGLRRDREEARSRVERLIRQIDQLIQAEPER